MAVSNSEEIQVKQEIEQAFREWIRVVTSGRESAPEEVLPLYDEAAVLWATLSPVMRDTPEKLRDYFRFFAGLPQLRAEVKHFDIRVFGDTAANSGAYTFIYRNGDEVVSVPARFSFVYVRKPQGWVIISHHSSRFPEPVV